MRIWNLCCEFNENLAVCLRKNALYRGKGRFFLKCAVGSFGNPNAAHSPFRLYRQLFLYIPSLSGSKLLMNSAWAATFAFP